MLGLTTRGLLGIALMIAGALAFLPGLSIGAGTVLVWLLVPAAAALTLGTYLVGTDVRGRVV
jgi:hypothetical protein